MGIEKRTEEGGGRGREPGAKDLADRRRRKKGEEGGMREEGGAGSASIAQRH